MRTWNLQVGDPLSLVIAADARLGPTDYLDDQIWELQIQAGEPSALALHTTFGLRARSMRLFPRFIESDLIQTDPQSFPVPITIKQFFPNYMQVTFAPLPEIDVNGEYWVPESHAIAGHFQFHNRRITDCQVRVEIVALLTPGSEGHRMALVELGDTFALAGQTGKLAPVLFLTGSSEASSSPYPCLAQDLTLAPGERKQLIWVLASLKNPGDSFELDRQIAARSWEIERSRLEMLNAGQLEIFTGDPDWDVTFAMAQKDALGLFYGPDSRLPARSFVLSRQSDQGYSPRGDGSDYNHLWNGQTALDTLYLSGFIFPAYVDQLHELIDNFLSTQNEKGVIEWKPGPAGQKSQLAATPILAGLAWQIYQAYQDQNYLIEVFPRLLAYLRAWFSSSSDRDGDGIPEWSHPFQAGFEDHPAYAYWNQWASGTDITAVETSALCAMLYRECMVLEQMAAELGRKETIAYLHALAEPLKNAVESSWNQTQSIYQDWDRDSHLTTEAKPLGYRQGPGDIRLYCDLDLPARLNLRIQLHGSATRRVQIFIHGRSPSGAHRVERIQHDRLHWSLGFGSATSERVYAMIEHIEVQGVDLADEVIVSIAGTGSQEHTLFLPLWAGIPMAERAEVLVHHTVMDSDRFWRDYGIRACASPPASELDSPVCWSIHLPWNTLIGEGLLAYGFRSEAAELVTRLMPAVIQSLKKEGTVRRYYHADSGTGFGERGVLHGLAPVGLFLETLGVKVFNPRRVKLEGFNPFPWPVTIKYRGLTIHRQKDKTLIIFPGSEAVTIETPDPCIVTLE